MTSVGVVVNLHHLSFPAVAEVEVVDLHYQVRETVEEVVAVVRHLLSSLKALLV
jgi:hypothetical protein